MEEIEVTAPNSPTVIFPCRCWLAENEDDGKTARVLAPGESVTHPYDSKSAFSSHKPFELCISTKGAFFKPSLLA